MGAVSILEPAGIGLGMTECQKFRAELKPLEITYKKNDVFMFLTDGFLDTMNPQQIPFGEDRILNLLTTNHMSSATELMSTLSKEVQNYSHQRQFDDSTGIIVKITD
jgi:serine phosphatase RsbU (regulator of sigma subunit)